MSPFEEAGELALAKGFRLLSVAADGFQLIDRFLALPVLNPVDNSLVFSFAQLNRYLAPLPQRR